jgi:hypothetical protein
MPEQESNEMPTPPSAWLRDGYGTGRRQPYRIELWCEKSTMNGILEPIAEHYGATFVPGTGETSTTRCLQVIDRAEADEGHRPVRILYISDFDPAGLSMPVAASRKIEFFARNRNLDPDIQLIPIALTHDQCVEYRLPRTPLKATEMRKEKFEERYGAGATELDALEALHPGVLRRIVTQAILRFYDDTLAERTRGVGMPITAKLTEVSQAAQNRHRDDIDRLRKKFEQMAADYAEQCAAWETEAKPVWQMIADEIDDEIDEIMDGVEWPEPRKADEYEAPLYDSTRTYTEQIEHYKKFQGKAADDDDDYGGAP